MELYTTGIIRILQWVQNIALR